MRNSSLTRSRRRAGDAAMVREAVALLARVAGPAAAFDSTSSERWIEVYRRAHWWERWADIDALPEDSAGLLSGALLRMHALGNLRRLALAPDPRDLLPLAERHPHFAALVEELADEVALARRTPQAAFRMQPRLLTGPAGVGKTTFAEELARKIGTRYRFLSMSAETGGFRLGGLSLGWGNAAAGEFHNYLAATAGATANGILLLDELDKVTPDARFSPVGVLYRLLEPTSADHYRDDAVQIDLDASHLNWIATANYEQLIEPALRSRFITHYVRQPTPVEAMRIAHHIYADLRTRAPWGITFDARLPGGVAELLAELGPRAQSQALRRAFAKAARDGRSALAVGDVTANANDDVAPDAKVDVAAKTKVGRQPRPYHSNRVGFLAEGSLGEAA